MKGSQLPGVLRRANTLDSAKALAADLSEAYEYAKREAQSSGGDWVSALIQLGGEKGVAAMEKVGWAIIKLMAINNIFGKVIDNANAVFVFFVVKFYNRFVDRFFPGDGLWASPNTTPDPEVAEPVPPPRDNSPPPRNEPLPPQNVVPPPEDAVPRPKKEATRRAAKQPSYYRTDYHTITRSYNRR
ncbi:hypothetical protein N7449_004338 [Penicillium cf. viridicatum]|uniref:Uncharacterized protein n=1 Tax=Penicillium cf. viridicatum TaxID=2972119 RepID=A0A9W9MJ32_9EURO|nr:hypothetical protein N7449_004338 [Penicillium cf. viridicatum]